MESLKDICIKFMNETRQHEDSLMTIKSSIKSYPDFPKKGVLFWDIFSVLKYPMLSVELFKCLERTVHYNKCSDVDVFVGLDSRGFLFATHLALMFKKPFVPIRKVGKLPGTLQKVTYQLEYGEDSMEIQEGSITEGQKVIIVDDLLATGGTLKAANDLVTKCKGTVCLNLICIELDELKGREKVKTPIASLVNF